MNRRKLLKMACNYGLLSIPISSQLARAALQENNLFQYILIHDSRRNALNDLTALIEGAARDLNTRNPSWREHLTFLDLQTDSDKILELIKSYGPNTPSLSTPILIAKPTLASMDTRVEIWTTEWLKFRRFDETCYPISGGWFPVEGNWHPTIDHVRNHLKKSPNHTSGKFDPLWLDLLKFEELQSLHSDHHRAKMFLGFVHWKYVNKECPT